MKLSFGKMFSVFAISLAFMGCGNGDGGGGGGGGGGNQPLQNLQFGTPVTLPAGSVPAASKIVLVGDFNNDQKLDFVVVNDAIGVFLGNGDGTFGGILNALSPLGTSPQAIDRGEFDSQNPLDIVTAASGSNAVELFFDGNPPDGQFASEGLFNVGNDPRGVVVADFNNDGIDDIAATNAGDDSMTIRFGNGDATFGTQTYASGGALSAPRNLVAADFDGDGDIDVAVANFGADHVTLWSNSGSFGNLANLFPAANADTSLTLPTSPLTFGIITADFDEDGSPDLAVPNPGTKNLSVFINNGDGTFPPRIDLPAGTDAFGANSGDFNLDGNLDLVVVNTFGVNGVDGDFCVYLGDGDGGFAAPKTFTAGMDAGQPNHPRSVAVGDFNGDDKPDLVFANSPGDSVSVILNTSN